MNKQFDLEEEALINDLNRGDITLAEFRRAMRELQRDYQYAAEVAAGDAYDREMSRWYVP